MTLKEFMHTPNSYLDNLAREAEFQRTTDEETAYEKYISKREKEENEMTCKDCPYFWKEEDESYPSCKWTIRCPDDIPPCEEDEED